MPQQPCIIVNCTGAPVVLQLPGGSAAVSIPPEVRPAQCLPRMCASWDAGLGVPVHSYPEWGPVENLPEPRLGRVYLVTMEVLAQAPANRLDLFAPGPLLPNGVVPYLIAAPGL